VATSRAPRWRQLPPSTPFALCSLQAPRAPSPDVALQVVCTSFQTLALLGRLARTRKSPSLQWSSPSALLTVPARAMSRKLPLTSGFSALFSSFSRGFREIADFAFEFTTTSGFHLSTFGELGIKRIGNERFQVDLWLHHAFCRILAEDVRRRYLTLLVNAMSRCTLFLVAEPLPFNADLVHGFCIATLEECTKAQMIERLLSVCFIMQLIAFLYSPN
jgi:hypothetical protein